MGIDCTVRKEKLSEGFGLWKEIGEREGVGEVEFTVGLLMACCACIGFCASLKNANFP